MEKDPPRGDRPIKRCGDSSGQPTNVKRRKMGRTSEEIISGIWEIIDNTPSCSHEDVVAKLIGPLLHQFDKELAMALSNESAEAQKRIP
ncbi:uncharacterized protein DMAD_00694 [Drosophila madeirensis]|uniref:Uncharacterized protein n=1 Tax=Drosophila madeirensis TaxID=30013 RepID=A0AAU9FXA6_DROMD